MMSDSPNQSVNVLIHPTQFPKAVEAAMLESLRSREMNHKFHYDTPKQALRWLRLHEALSPARTDPDCNRIYNASMASCAAHLLGTDEVEVISLGCGGGQKEAQLFRHLIGSQTARRLRYAPVDVSAGLALIARSAAIDAGIESGSITPMCIDLAESGDWRSALLPVLSSMSRRVICFFGMLPNFVSGEVMPQLAALLRDDDLLLVSANLAPGTEYHSGVTRVLPCYDNALTRDWLWTVLLDLGVERNAGEIEFAIVSCPVDEDLLRIEARVNFSRDFQIEYVDESFDCRVGESIRLFFSYRHTPARLSLLLASQQISIIEGWTNQNGDEGVFLCERTAR